MFERSEYHKAICEENKKLSEIPNSIFIGQQVGFKVDDFYGTLKDIPAEKRLEMPITEELQLGMSLGLSLENYLPISIFQRMDFLPRACDQLVNHLDLIEELSRNAFCPKVIVRVTIGSVAPINTGLQHSKDLTEGFSKLLRNIKVMKVTTPEEVREAYKFARETNRSTIIVEIVDLYND